MRLPIAALVFASVSSLLAGQAKAEWQGVEWGMTQAEVQKTTALKFQLSNDNVVGMADKGLLSFEYRFNSFSFTGYVYFVDDKVTMLQLASKEMGACTSVMNTLSRSLGEPDMVGFQASGGVSTLPVFLDRTRKDAFRVLEIASINFCQVRITPLPAGSGSF